MITEWAGSELDQRFREPTVVPRFRVELFSRNQPTDSDSVIVTGQYRQTPIDITNYVVSVRFRDSDSDASTLDLTISLQGSVNQPDLSPELFFNCLIRYYVGVDQVPAEDWIPKFTGVHQGQPASTEAPQQSLPGPTEMLTRRGSNREVSVTCAGRESLYSKVNITSPGRWLPKGAVKQNDPEFSFRDEYDDIGSIVREIATSGWGMGLDAAEVAIGPLPYRIAKQLQIVDESVWTAITNILQPLHLVPYFDGAGVLRTIEQRVNKGVVRSFSRGQCLGMPAQQGNQRPVNAVRVTGLSSEITEVVHASQRLGEFRGTFGFFDPEILFKGFWGGDETESFRVKLGQVTDGNGVVVQSPRFDEFTQEGFILAPVYPPEFVYVDEYRYEIRVRNDVFLTAAAIAALIGGYSALAIQTTTAPEIDTGVADVPNPLAIASEIASSLLLVAGLTVLQQIGNFRFVVRGVPFETVYKELPHLAQIQHASAFDEGGIGAIRRFELVPEEHDNYVFSSYEDMPTDSEVVNKGLVTWAIERLAFVFAQGAGRSLEMTMDPLLEPGDIIAFQNQAVYISSMSQQSSRGTALVQSIDGFQVRKL